MNLIPTSTLSFIATRRKRGFVFGFMIVIAMLCGLAPEDASAQLFKFARKKNNAPPVVFQRVPTQAELLQHIASKSEAFRQLSSDLRISLDGTPQLRGTMQLELPKRLRIKAGVMGVSQFGVDVGSNEQDFWVWTKVNLPRQKPAIFFASHEGYKQVASTARNAIPLEPVWLLEGLGLIDFESTDVHRGPDQTPEGFLRLYSMRQTPTGRNIRVTLIHPQQGTILQQALYDSQSRLIAYTNSTDYRSFPERGISLPEKIEMYLFQNGQQVKMVIETSDYQFDSLFGDPNQMWAMPQPKGIQSVNLVQ